MKKLVIIHTTSATIQSLSDLAKECMPDVEIVNILDDSILKDMIKEDSQNALVEQRWNTYAKMGELMGADGVLSACSTVGEFADKMNRELSIPVYRIDEAMAEEAVKRGINISVFATLQSTLNPTVSLIHRKAKSIGKECNIQTCLVEGAYDQLMAGNKEEHNRRIKEVVCAQAGNADCLVLAQASMAGALEGLEEEVMKKVLTSPVLGMKKVNESLRCTK